MKPLSSRDETCELYEERKRYISYTQEQSVKLHYMPNSATNAFPHGIFPPDSLPDDIKRRAHRATRNSKDKVKSSSAAYRRASDCMSGVLVSFHICTRAASKEVATIRWFRRLFELSTAEVV